MPLALHLAGSFLHTYRDTRLGMPAAYLSQLHKYALQDPALQGRGASQSPTRHAQNVELTFKVSYQRLQTTDPIDERAHRLLARAACFAPGTPLPRDLLKATLSEAEKTFEEELEIEDALRRLVALGLVEEVEEQTVRLHRLLAEFVRQQEKTTYSEAQSAVGQMLLEQARQLNSTGYSARLLALQPHLRAITNAALPNESELAASLSNELGLHLMKLGAFSEAQFYFQQALAIRQKVLGSEHPDVATSLNGLAWLYWRQGKDERAEPLYQQALAICQKVLE